MTIFPHPDDETIATGGLLAVAHQLGWQTIAVVLTGGEAGQIYFRPKGKTAKEIRALELEKAKKILGISKLVKFDLGDGKLKNQRVKISQVINQILLEHNPAIVVTYDFSGFYGHPDHIITSVVVKEVIKNLTVAKKIQTKLFWLTYPKWFLEKFRRQISFFGISEFICLSNFRLRLGKNWLKKWRSARAHKSQSLGRNWPLPLGLSLFLYHYEWYHEADLNKNYPYKLVD